MQQSPHVLAGTEPSGNEKQKGKIIELQAIWVIVGFLFWFGFYLGALIMHAIHR